MTRSKIINRIFFFFLYKYHCFSSIVDDMGRRIDDLERNIAHIISQTNAELP
jgi:hypothetical protein